jgi:hypothetical protein
VCAYVHARVCVLGVCVFVRVYLYMYMRLRTTPKLDRWRLQT